MGDNRTKFDTVALHVGRAAVGVQLVAGYVTAPAHPYIAFMAVLLTAPDVVAIGMFTHQLRHRPGISPSTAVIGVTFLAWHVRALAILVDPSSLSDLKPFAYLVMNDEISIGYQAAQVVAFGLVVVASLLPRRAEVPPPS